MILRRRQSESSNAQHRVRQNFREYTQDVFNDATRRNRALLILAPLLSLLQLILVFTTTGLFWPASCNRPLHIFLLLTGLQVSVQAPLAFIAQLRRADNGFRHPSTRWLFLPNLAADAAFLGIHILGNIWVWAPSSTCSVDAVVPWSVSVAVLVMGYTRLLIPAMWVIAITFCLPCLVVMFAQSSRESGAASGRDDAITEDELKLLETVRVKLEFTPRNSIALQEMPVGASMLNETPSGNRSIWSRLLRTNTPTANGVGLEEVVITSAQEAVCPICLDRFTDNEVIRRFHCQHLFHVECSDTWLVMNGKCPMCKRVVKDGLRKRKSVRSSRAQELDAIASELDDIALEVAIIESSAMQDVAVAPAHISVIDASDLPAVLVGSDSESIHESVDRSYS